MSGDDRHIDFRSRLTQGRAKRGVKVEAPWRRLRYVVLLIALCAIATCPAAKRACTTKQRDAEADALLGYLADRIAAHVAAHGRVPPTAAGPTPPRGCCDEGGACRPEAATWEAAGWRELGFSVDGPYRYVYQYVPDPGGLAAVLRAVGDVDCDGRASTLEVKLTVVGRTIAQVWSRDGLPPRRGSRGPDQPPRT